MCASTVSPQAYSSEFSLRLVSAGKTLNITQQLTNGLPAEMVPVFLTFSARTSANQTQDIIDSKMDKRRKVSPPHIPLTSPHPPPPSPLHLLLPPQQLSAHAADSVCLVRMSPRDIDLLID